MALASRYLVAYSLINGFNNTLAVQVLIFVSRDFISNAESKQVFVDHTKVYLSKTEPPTRCTQ